MHHIHIQIIFYQVCIIYTLMKILHLYNFLTLEFKQMFCLQEERKQITFWGDGICQLCKFRWEDCLTALLGRRRGAEGGPSPALPRGSRGVRKDWSGWVVEASLCGKTTAENPRRSRDPRHSRKFREAHRVQQIPKNHEFAKCCVVFLNSSKRGDPPFSVITPLFELPAPNNKQKQLQNGTSKSHRGGPMEISYFSWFLKS